MIKKYPAFLATLGLLISATALGNTATATKDFTITYFPTTVQLSIEIPYKSGANTSDPFYFGAPVNITSWSMSCTLEVPKNILDNGKTYSVNSAEFIVSSDGSMQGVKADVCKNYAGRDFTFYQGHSKVTLDINDHHSPGTIGGMRPGVKTHVKIGFFPDLSKLDLGSNLVAPVKASCTGTVNYRYTN